MVIAKELNKLTSNPPSPPFSKGGVNRFPPFLKGELIDSPLF
jgi:hypothetical protein